MPEERKLGLQAYIGGFACQGKQDAGEALDTLKRIASKIQMRYDGLHAAIWEYPAFGGGGEGFTVAQPVMESILLADAWPELLENGTVFFLLLSCKNFDVLMPDIVDIISSSELDVVDVFFTVLDATKKRGKLDKWHIS